MHLKSHLFPIKQLLPAFIFIHFFTPCIAQTSTSHTWVFDNADGAYKNPVLHADYSDPDAIRVGKDYYLVASSFNHVPCLPILHSTDLVNWTLIGHALQKLTPEDRYDRVQHGNGRPTRSRANPHRQTRPLGRRQNGHLLHPHNHHQRRRLRRL